MNDQEERLVAEIETRVKELRVAVTRGDPPAHWRAKRAEIDDLQLRLNHMREEREWVELSSL